MAHGAQGLVVPGLPFPSLLHSAPLCSRQMQHPIAAYPHPPCISHAGEYLPSPSTLLPESPLPTTYHLCIANQSTSGAKRSSLHLWVDAQDGARAGQGRALTTNLASHACRPHPFLQHLLFASSSPLLCAARILAARIHLFLLNVPIPPIPSCLDMSTLSRPSFPPISSYLFHSLPYSNIAAAIRHCVPPLTLDPGADYLRSSPLERSGHGRL
ncbi:hypothetical protein Vafri_6714 [Volvox africanus]|uniref:Uncharacterized protein n=1 Tax=Volvox africanus TaxID=51714 RepID=A0A8J4AYW8_9CHLO|nr:hypothetical protein Vafri_6714 [Volvox africanus]